MKINPIVRLIRPAHWVKNLLVFVPLFFSGSMADVDSLTGVALAFCSCCCAASAVYVLNDLMDVEMDRRHPTKCSRPIASGEVSAPLATSVCALLAVSSLVLALFCAGLVGVALVGAYLAINVGYSMGLKRVPLLDVTLLSSGYVLRVVFGAAAAGVQISGWLYLTVMTSSFALGLGKRRGEADAVGTGSRDVLRGYTRDFLDRNMYMCLGLTVAFYSLWARESSARLLTVPLMLVILMRYSLDVERGGDGDPMGVVASDRALAVLALAYGVFAFVLVYMPGVVA